MLRALAVVNAPRHPETNLYDDPERGGALTLSRGPKKRWRYSLYDKQHETAARARRIEDPRSRALALAEADRACGLLRAELVLRRPRLRELRLGTVMDLNEDVLMSEHRAKFHTLGFDRQIVGIQTLVDRVAGAPELSPHDKTMMLGQALFDYYGADSGLKAETQRKHRRHLTQLGMTPEGVFDVGPPLRLDYDLGHLVEA